MRKYTPVYEKARKKTKNALMETTSFTQNRIVNCFSLIHLKELQSALCHCFNTHTSLPNNKTYLYY